MNTQAAMTVIDPQRVDELSQQLVKYMPGGSKLTINEAYAMARISLMHGLDPFVGDLYYMKRKDGTPIGIKVGIRAVRKKAMQQANESGGSYWVTFRQLSIDDMKALRIPPDSLSFECRLYDTATITKYVESVATLHTAGLSWLEIQPILGDKPYTTGIGVYRQGEETKMAPVQCGQKRAEEDALKRRYYLPFDISEAETPTEEMEPENTIEGTTRDVTDEQKPEEKKAQAEQDKRDLFGAEQKPPAPEQPQTTSTNTTSQRPYDAPTLRAKIGEYVKSRAMNAPAQNGELKAAMASLSGLVHGKDHERKAVMRYLFGKDSGNNLTAGEAKELSRWIGAKPNGSGEWIPSEHAIQEVQAVLVAEQIERGQATMPLTGDPVLDKFAA